MKVQIYTDGSSRGNPGPGGFGAILAYGKHRKEISAGYKLTTNNRMELMAVNAALEQLNRMGLEVDIYTDSKYVCQAVEEGWLWGWLQKGFAGKKNEDLWREFVKHFRNHKIKFHWIRGHNGHPENERCDKLATAAADDNPILVDMGYIRSLKQDGNGPMML